MIRHIHHPSCPAGHTAGASCICPKGTRRSRGLATAGEVFAFAAMLGCIAALPIYLLWRYGA